MSARYLLKVTTSFSAAHRLRDYQDNCQHIHGHNWHTTVEVEATQLNDIGMGVDFYAIEAAAQDTAKVLDHRFINEIPPFDLQNPTAENIAAWFYQRVSEKLNSEHVRVKGIHLQETDNLSVYYTED